MDTDLPWMLEYIDSFLALPKLEQRKYQMARRMGFLWTGSSFGGCARATRKSLRI